MYFVCAKCNCTQRLVVLMTNYPLCMCRRMFLTNQSKSVANPNGILHSNHMRIMLVSTHTQTRTQSQCTHMYLTMYPHANDQRSNTQISKSFSRIYHRVCFCVRLPGLGPFLRRRSQFLMICARSLNLARRLS